MKDEPLLPKKGGRDSVSWPAHRATEAIAPWLWLEMLERLAPFHRRRPTLAEMVARLVGVILAFLFLSAVVVYGVFGADVWRWGCPSQAEQAKPWSPDGVQSAFAGTGLDLVRVGWPAGLRRARSYRGAAVFRHERRGAVLHVLVCSARCSISRFQIRPGKPRVQVRFGFDLGTNVVGWISGSDRAAAARLRHALSEPLDALDRSPAPGSRCYIG